MNRGEQDSRQVESAVSVMRPLVHILQITRRKKVTKHSPKPGKTEWRKHLTNNNGGSHEVLD